MDTPRILVVVLVFFFLFISPESHRPSQSQQSNLHHRIVNEHKAISLLNITKYGTFDPGKNLWINITGLRQDDGYAWNVLSQVQERAREQVSRILGGIPSNSPSSSSNSPFRNENGPGLYGYFENISYISVYQNVTGTIRGQWTRSGIEKPLVKPILNLSALTPDISYSTRQYNRNITGDEGKISIKLDQQSSRSLASEHGFVRGIRAEMVIKDKGSTGDGWEMTLHGLHYPEKGGIVLVTTSQKFAGIFALPHFTLSNNSFLIARQFLTRNLADAVTEQETSNSPSLNPWSSSPNDPSEFFFPTPHCEFIVYLQQHPTGIAKDKLITIERELRYPTGANLPTAPAMKMSAVIFSPDCGFVLESKGPPEFSFEQGTHLVGQKLESYIRQARFSILVFAIIVCCEIFLLIRQMKEASTPSTRSRVSFYTVGIMALGDGFACLVLMVISTFFEAAFLLLISTAFLAFLCVSFFGMKFLLDIWTVQAPERLEIQRRNAAANSITAPTPASSTNQPALTPAVISTAGADTLPLLVTSRRPEANINPPVILTPDQNLEAAEADDAAATQPTERTAGGSARRELGALYSRFYFLLIGILFLSLHSRSWPTFLRTIYTNVLTFAYLSFWIPQIHRNIVRNCRKAFRWEFVTGQSVLRLAPFVYFNLIDPNVLFVETDPNIAFILIGWIWIQVWLLVSQEVLGPRFFIPDGWAPPAYDYHPIFRDSDQENGTLPIGFTQATVDSAQSEPSEARGTERSRIFDCAICMQNLEVPVINTTEGDGGVGLAGSIFTRRAYMVTPCRHIFHTPCLEGWMRYRLQCPICRNSLPPL